MLLQQTFELTVLLFACFGLLWLAEKYKEIIDLETSAFYASRAAHLNINVTEATDRILKKLSLFPRKSVGEGLAVFEFHRVTSELRFNPKFKESWLFRKSLPLTHPLNSLVPNHATSFEASVRDVK